MKEDTGAEFQTILTTMCLTCNDNCQRTEEWGVRTISRNRQAREQRHVPLAHSSTVRGRSAALVGCPTRTVASPLMLMRADPSHPRHAVISCGAAPGRRGSRQTGSWPSLPCRPAT